MLRLFSLLLFFACLIALGWWALYRPADVAQPYAVQLEKVDLANELLLTGSVVNDQKVTITALLNGQIFSINAREGDVIAAGETLAQLDSELSEAVLERAMAEQAYKEQELASLRTSANRLRRLFKTKSVSRQALDEALSAVQRAEGAVHVSNADVKVATINVDNATIKAPFESIVTKQSAEVGQWVEAGTQLFTLVATTGRVIEAYVDAGDLGSVSLGQKVTLKTNAYPDAEWESALSWISPVVGESNNRNAPINSFAVRFPLGEDAPDMLLGQLVDVSLETERRDQALALPLTAVTERAPGEFYVWIESANKAQRKSVSTGLMTIEHAEIIEGLSEGDWVLSTQGVRLENGLSIEPIKNGEQ